MKRLLAAVAVTPLVLLALGGPAAAAKPDTKPTHTSEGATYAHAEWMSESTDTYVEGGLSAVHTRKGPVLVLYHAVYSEGGAWSETFIVDTDQVPFTLTMDRARLTRATLSAEKVPVTTCAYDYPDDEDPDCDESTVDMSLTWTGEGPISRSGDSAHFSDGNVRINTHISTVERAAQVSGELTGAVEVDDFSYGSMVKSKFVEITRCRTECEELPQE